MKTQDIITDDYVTKMAVAYSESARVLECDWRALKIAMCAAAEKAASAVGSPLEGGTMNPDGSWAATG